MEEPAIDPCKPSPCGPNSQCQVINDSPSCSCLPEFSGSPPNCRPECISNSECPSQFACINQKCKNPCIGSCGSGADCYVVSHTPMCTCLSGYTGDPFSQCIFKECKNYFSRENLSIYNFEHIINVVSNFTAIIPLPMPIDLCNPSPCGSNAICKELNGAGSCTCISNYIGNPYEGCRPECLLNSDCSANQACMNSKCQDPCPGICGRNAECHVINHLPVCECYPGHTGNAFVLCSLMLPGIFYKTILWKKNIVKKDF